jgi:hypothetical protein
VQHAELRISHQCAAGKTELCRLCREQLQSQLTRIPDLYAGLEAALILAPVAGDRVTGSGRPGIPLNVEAVEARAAIRGTLAAWADLTAEARGVRPVRRTVPALAGFLRRHIDWLATHPAAHDLVTEVDAATRRGVRIAQPPAERYISVGACIEPDCPGSLIAMVHDPDALLPSVVECDTDTSHRWPAGRWNALRRPGAAAPTGLTAREISATWRMPTGTVYWLANEHKWRRERTGRRVHYAQEDVLRTLGSAVPEQP